MKALLLGLLLSGLVACASAPPAPSPDALRDVVELVACKQVVGVLFIYNRDEAEWVSGSNLTELAKHTKLVDDMHHKIAVINIGCPSDKTEL